MQNKLFSFSGTLFLLLGSLPVFSQSLNAFSATQCVDYAVKNSIQVKNALIDIKIQEETNREYTSAAFPRLSGSISTNFFPQVATQVFPNFIAAATYGVLQDEGVKDGNGNPIISPKDFGFVQAQFGTKYSSSVGLELSQLLFDGQVFVGLQARSTAMQLSRKNVEVTQENIKVNILKIYYQLVAGRKQLGTLDANIDRVEKLLHDTKEYFKNGFAEKLDVDKLIVTKSNLETEKQKLEKQIESGYLGLKLLMGMPVRDGLVLTDSLPENELKKDVLDQAYNYADRKEVQQLEIATRLREFNVRRYQLSKIPTIALFGQLSTNAQRNSFNFFKTSEKWYPTSLIGLKISSTIFQGFGRNAQIQRARYELDQTRNNMDLLKQSIDHDVEQARLKIQTALLTLDNQKRNQELAENVYLLTVKKYEQGLGSNQEITIAQTELRLAQTNYYSALYEAIVAKIDFQKAMGKL